MKSQYPLILVSAACLTLLAPSARAAVINGVNFTTTYEGTITPKQLVPAWTENIAHDPLNMASATPNYNGEGYMRLDTSYAGGINYYYQAPAGLWDHGASGSTIEFSLRVNSQIAETSNANAIYFSNGSKDYRFYFTTEKMIVGNIGSAFGEVALAPGQFSTVRFVMSGSGVLDVYLNGSTTAALSGYTGTASVSTEIFYFGDSGSGGGIVDWSYVAFTNSGAFAPVPEPSAIYTITGAALAGLLLLRRRLAGTERRKG